MIADRSHTADRGGEPGSWSANLLTRIAATIGSRQRENVATTALLYVMQAHPAAQRAVVADWVRRAGLVLGVGPPADLFFAEQDFGTDGQPDLVGHDETGLPRVIVEAKIEAGFQPEQMARYSTRFDPGMSSVLVVLAPERRLSRLVQEANGQLARGLAMCLQNATQ
jgi:hypothetical protein